MSSYNLATFVPHISTALKEFVNKIHVALLTSLVRLHPNVWTFPLLQARGLFRAALQKSLSAECCLNSQFIESTTALRQTFCRLPLSLLGVPTSPYFINLLQYGLDLVELIMNVYNYFIKTFLEYVGQN